MAPRLPADAVVLITGASTGLGLALARRLLEGSSFRLLLTARESSLPRFGPAGIEESDRVWFLPLDVTDVGQRAEVVRAAEARWGGVDVLVNNAGTAFRSVVEHVSRDEFREQMQVNFQGPMSLSRQVLPAMRERRRGRILNVSSVGGMMAMPTMAAYSASKFALEGATEALWYEVRPWGIRVTLVEPGFVRSDGFLRTRYTLSSARDAGEPSAPYHQHYRHMGRFIERLMTGARATPESIARRMHRVIERRFPPLRLQATSDARFFSLLRRLLPQALYHEVLYWSLPGMRTWGPKGDEPEAHAGAESSKPAEP